MGSFCTSGPEQTITNKTETHIADPRVAAAGEQSLKMAQDWASRPFETPAAPVAGFNPFQQQAFSQIHGLQGGLNPYFQSAGQQMTEAGSPVTQADISSYMNPYADAAMASMKKYVFDPQRRNAMGSAVQSAGGVGADRLALTSQNLDKTQADAIGGAQAGFYSNAMQQAQRAKEMALQSAGGWANLGLGYQTGQLQGTSALAGAGAQQQGQTQRELMSPYEQTLARIAYPGQQASFLAGITGNMSNVFKGTTNTQGETLKYAAQPSMMNQIVGLGTAAAGLAMGNPFGAASMFSPGMMASAPAMWGGFPSTQNQGFGMSAGMGGLGYEDGGSVNHWNGGQGYNPGGGVEEYTEDQFNPIGAASVDYSRPLERPAPNLGMWPFNRGQADYKGDVTMFDSPQTLPVQPPLTVGPEAPGLPPPQSNPWNVPANAGTMPMPDAYTKPLPPAIPSPIPKPTAIAQSPDRAGPYRAPPLASSNINADMKIGDHRMPRDEMPYPDSTERDWGQKLTRSPWMSLVSAGLKMAQSTKSGAAGLAEGLEAGVSHLDKQRGELRNEEQINQKAESLYQHAKAELNKYTKKTPHQLATEELAERRLEQDRYQWQPGTGIDPATGQTVSGAYRLPTRSGEAPQFIPGATLTGKGSGATALMKNVEYLVNEKIAPNKDAAFTMIRQSVHDRATYTRLVQAQIKSLQAAMPGTEYNELVSQAEKIVRGLQQQVGPGGSPTPAEPTPGGNSAATAMPDPGAANRVKGSWYIVNGVARQWLGT